jgi:PAS domain S-box-containing protein
MKKKKILIIEDDRILRENITDFLKLEGYEVTVADNGLSGASIAMKEIPDLILCDIMMPGMDGMELFKTLQQIKTTSAIPLIFVTAKSEKEDIRSGMQLGADDYITKPFDLNELHQAVKVRLEKQERFQKVHDEKFFALIDNPLMGVFIYSEKKFEYVNNTFAEMFGLKVSDFENMSFDDIIATEPSSPIVEKIRRTLKGIQENVQLEFEALSKNNDKNQFIQLYANLISYKGASALIGNAVNINEKENKTNLFKTKDNTDNLSKREIDILKEVCLGHSTTEIAAAKKISTRTVDSHRSNLLEKTRCKNSAELILYALRKKIFVVD